MANADRAIQTYEDLARLCDRQGQPQMHDRFLVLAADAALNAGKGGDAERLRQQLLQQNPHHLLKPFASFAEAVRSDDVRNYVRALRRSHPPEAAEQLLRTLQGGEGVAPAPAAPTAREGPADLGTLDPAEPLKVYRMKEDSGQRPAVGAAGPGSAQVPPTLSVPRPDVGAGPPAPVAGPKPRAMPVPLGPAPAKGERVLPNARPVPPDLKREVYGVRQDPLASRTRAAEDGEDDGRAHLATVWVSNVLTGLTLLAGVGLTAYTFARPFLPPEWFR